jgi:hypothetical protein
MSTSSTPPIYRLLTALVLAGALSSCAIGMRGSADSSGVTLSTVPTGPEYISGGDALIRVESPGIDPHSLTITLNGTDVRASFQPAPPDWLGRPSSNALLGLVTGLVDGRNEVEARLGGKRVAALTITNYPITGPIFSGPHLTPYFCLNQLQPAANGQPRRFAIGNGEFVSGAPLDANCTYPTRVDYVYRTRGDSARFLPLADPGRLPANVAEITTPAGVRVPYVVRLETGTINRAIYQTAVVVDPAAPAPTPWRRSPGWNGRLVYTFGGGCEAGFFQGTSTGGVLNASMLSAGYAIASSTLNVNSQGGCNDPLSAETAMMVKERFAEVYGPPVHTIGSGGSGGAQQQLLIAGAYPGILNGILPSLTFPDATSYFMDSTECYLLRDYLNGRQDLDDETRRRIGGWATWQTCSRTLGGRPNRVGPYDCPDVIPETGRYDAAKNPAGARCSIYDGMQSVFGTRVYPEIAVASAAGIRFARNPHDNVGVQYGLEALQQGLITKDLFLDLNENVGGWDIDFNRRPQRTEADPAALRIVYETGRVTSGSGGLAVTPIIDDRTYTDPTGDFHTSYYSFVLRARLLRDNGDLNNYVLQRHSSRVSRSEENLATMDRWLTNLALDRSSDPLRARITRARPEDLVEACWDDQGNRIAEPQEFDPERLFVNDQGKCNALFPIYTGPRLVSGGPLTNDVFKCELKPLRQRDYKVSFAAEEWARLERIFPRGVCDYSRPGVAQLAHTRTWLSFGPSSVNRYR